MVGMSQPVWDAFAVSLPGFRGKLELDAIVDNNNQHENASGFIDIEGGRVTKCRTSADVPIRVIRWP